jgi:hypothetical protein
LYPWAKSLNHLLASATPPALSTTEVSSYCARRSHVVGGRELRERVRLEAAERDAPFGELSLANLLLRGGGKNPSRFMVIRRGRTHVRYFAFGA